MTYLKIPLEPEKNYKKPQDSKQPKGEPDITRTQVQRLPVYIPGLCQRTSDSNTKKQVNVLLLLNWIQQRFHF